ncbi:MAG: electron transfer flavoprotein subunit beta/FixA family protein [Desulfobacteraceae bacterium]|nr:electron transfer flavoprotein subunit beta/FixA family protein [Desulfobacteraceae bacterium]
MKILVCIKQGLDDGKMSRFDEFALEEALALKDKLGKPGSLDVVVDVITAGPVHAVAVLKRAFGMGADRGIHIITRDIGYMPAFVTASNLAVVAGRQDYDLILTGIMSQDMMEGQTGPMLAEFLGMPCATAVVKSKMGTVPGIVRVEREMENGYKDCLDVHLPAVLTIQAGINIPRYPSLSKMLVAAKKSITTLVEEDLFSNPVSPKEFLVAIEYPDQTRAGQRLDGSLDDQVRQFQSFLQEKGLV